MQTKPPFEDIIDKYTDLIYFFALRFEKNKEVVSDIVQETLVKAFEHYDRFIFYSEGQLKSWLLTICRNMFLSQIRITPTISFDESIDDTWNNNSEEQLASIIHKEEYRRVEKRITQLKPIEQELIKLRIFDDLRFHEIAVIFSISEVAVKMRFYRIISQLQEDLV